MLAPWSLYPEDAVSPHDAVQPEDALSLHDAVQTEDAVSLHDAVQRQSPKLQPPVHSLLKNDSELAPMGPHKNPRALTSTLYQRPE